jgi:hypothetical protein
VNGIALSLFERRVPRGTSLTLGPNSDESAPEARAMYLVFVR